MVKSEIYVLRYGHRHVRDYRVTTHCCLVARAFLAKGIFIEGEEDLELKNSVEKVVSKFGGQFFVEFVDDWKRKLRELQNKGFKTVHLTVYGEPLNKVIKGIKRHKKLVFIVGSQKVEAEVYRVVDFNVSVTNQPHSEIAALAVALDWCNDGVELKPRKEGNIVILPSKKGKNIVKTT